MRVVIVGAGGHGTVVADILLRMRDAGMPVDPVACVDDDPSTGLSHLLSVPLVRGGVAALRCIGHDAVVVAIGDNAARRRIGEDLRRAGMTLAIARHPASVVAPDVEIGPGTVICAGAVVNPASRIGWSAIINTQSSVDHHGRIGDYVHIAPGAHLGGSVSVGDGTLVGMGSTVLPGRRIGRGTIVGAGAVVISDLPAGVTAFGVPAHIQNSTALAAPTAGAAAGPRGH